MLDFIINERAGEKKAAKARKIIQKILEEKKIEYRFHPTKYRRHAIELTRELCENGADCIIAAGGDGTVNEVLNGITDFNKVKFGIIPCGSGNDFADTAKLSLKPEAALDLILNGTTKPTDFLVCGGIRCMNIGGAGIDVEILKRCENSKILKGRLKYVVSLLISLIKFKFYGFTLYGDKIDAPKDKANDLTKQKGEHRSAMIVCAGNGKKFGGGIPMCPEAELDDGLMDFIIIDEMKKLNMVKAFAHLMKGDILKEPYCDFTRREHIIAKFDKPVSVQIDGEIYDNIDFDVHIEKGKLNLFRP